MTIDELVAAIANLADELGQLRARIEALEAITDPPTPNVVWPRHP